MKSSVGICDVSVYGTTVGTALGWDELEFDPVKLAFFKHCVRYRINQLLRGDRIADPINIFVKQEPHSREKIESGRFRLISAISLVDTMIDRMVFKPLTKKILSSPTKTPCWLGWTPLLGGYKRISDKFGEEQTIAIDKSSWDWTMPGWLVKILLRLIKEMRIGIHPIIEKLMDARFELIFRDAVFRFKDGTMVFQTDWGVMKSGCYLTLVLNSFAQSYLHYIAADNIGWNMLSRAPITFGDDTLQAYIGPNKLKRYIYQLKRLGCLPKPTKPRLFKEFIGFLFYDDVVIPAYWSKHIYQLEHADPENLIEALCSYQILYAHYPETLTIIQKYISELCPERYISRSRLIRTYYKPD